MIAIVDAGKSNHVSRSPGAPQAGGDAISDAIVALTPFDSFKSRAWDSVAPDRRTPMQQHIWARAAVETLSPGKPVDVVSVGSISEPAALAPLSQQAILQLGRRRLLGSEELGEPVEVVYRDQAALKCLARGLVATRLPLSFGHYLADTPLIKELKLAYGRRGLVVVRPLPQRASPWISLDASWISPEAHFSARRRSDFRRMRRSAEKLGQVTTDIIVPEPNALPALLEEAMTIEERGWKGRAGTALAYDERQRRFYERYAALACEAGILRLCFLRIDGRAAAMQLAVETEGRFWLLKIGFDKSFKRCSPGNLLLRDTISYAAAKGLASYEFLGKEAEWTMLWTQNARPLVALRSYPFNCAGLVAALSDARDVALQRIAARKQDEQVPNRMRETDA